VVRQDSLDRLPIQLRKYRPQRFDTRLLGGLLQLADAVSNFGD